MNGCEAYSKAQWLIPVVPAILEVSSVFVLLLCWQIEHFLANSKLSIYLILCKPKVDDVEEACADQLVK
jgi:uncharacterized membrane protein YjdF